MPNIDIDLDPVAPGLAEAPVDEDAPLALVRSDAGVVDEDADPLDRLPAHAIQNADGSVTLPLHFPQTLQVKKNGQVRTDKYDRLTFHRLHGADLRAIGSAASESQDIVTFARSTRLPQAVMNALYDKLDGADIADGGRVLNSFFATGRKMRPSS